MLCSALCSARQDPTHLGPTHLVEWFITTYVRGVAAVRQIEGCEVGHAPSDIL